MLRRIIDAFRTRPVNPEPEKDREDTAPHKDGPQGGKPEVHSEIPRRQAEDKGSQGTEAARNETVEKPKPSRAPRAKWDLSQFTVEPVEGKTRFHDLDLPAPVMHAIHDLGFSYCTPIQAEVLPHTLAGADASGRAQTGTGKTAAFLITIFTHFIKNPIKGKREPGTPRALIMVPTRELALQVQKDARELGKYTRFKTEAVFGGMDYRKQQQTLTEQPVDILVATPGRLLDYQRHNNVHLNRVEILVIDEADQMLDMGFIPDMRQIIRHTPPKTKRQTLFFGATLTPEVNRLGAQWTRDPINVDIEPEQVAVGTVDQKVYLVTSRERFKVLYNLVTRENLERVIVFCNRRDTTRRLADRLKSYGLNCAVLSGDIDQKKRIKTLEGFRSGAIRVLVATDVAGRGIHVEDISHVVNYNLPLDPEDYVHRIGRTGRAGHSGISISFATEDESFHLPAIEEYLGSKLNCVYPDDVLLTKLPPPSEKGSVEQKAPAGSTKPRRRRRNPRKPRPKSQE